MPCNFSLKSHIWFQPILHPTQFSYHYKWYKHGRLKLSKPGYSSESSLSSSYGLQGTSEKKTVNDTAPFDNPPAIRFVWTADRLLWYLSQVLHFDKLSQKLTPLPPRNNELVTFPFDIHTLYIIHLISIWQTFD